MEIICVRRVRYSEVYEYFAAQISGLKISISGLKIWISGLKISISGLKILISGLKISISGQRNSGPPPEGMVPNVEPKNDLKKTKFSYFGSFLGFFYTL